MIAPDLLAAVGPLLDLLRAIGVRHYVGGSIASSAHGVARASIDADVVAELLPEHAERLCSALEGAYYVPEARVRDGIARRGSFNLIHLETMLKVDVFVSKDRPFDRRALERARPSPAEDPAEDADGRGGQAVKAGRSSDSMAQARRQVTMGQASRNTALGVACPGA